ncbi:hypothetical protein [Seonamhaeicola sp.]|uniref:hypothetical protein n=1 Tax=Seonamhaeicola sp. TaxID=1912245 RepID=UPI0026195FC9|nr:hypothetical protein [Seonamhaeicola sp.]
MRPIPKFLGLITVLCLLFAACLSDDSGTSSHEEDLETLNALKTEIETLVSSSVCNDNTECKYIAFGSKPCGGPWTYLIYSTSIDTDELESKVEQYNQLEAIFNAQYGAVSDCSVAAEPIDVICENNVCVAVY